MKNALAILFVGATLTLTATGAVKGPDIRIVDNKVSIQAESVPLGRLLRLLDQATGMTSKVPTELANRNISVRFSNLTLDEAVRKIFEGQPIDYFVVQGQSIQVTRLSQANTGTKGPVAFTQPAPQDNVFVEDNPPFLPPQQPGVLNQNQPAMIQTPFGQIPNPNANRAQQPQGIAPMVAPGQVAPNGNPFNNNGAFGSALPGFNGGTGLPTLQSNPPFGSPANTTPAQPSFPAFPTQLPPKPPGKV